MVMNELNEGTGFITNLKLSTSELATIRNFINKSYHDNLKNKYQDNYSLFLNCPIEEYHKSAHMINHSEAWPKPVRIFSKEQVDAIKKFSIFSVLSKVLGEFSATDLCPVNGHLGREDIYWRLVRPFEKSYAALMHADYWFWQRSKYSLPKGKQMLKAWIAVYCEPGKAGLMVVPHSQKQEYEFTIGEYGKATTVKDVSDKATVIPTNPGDIIIFHDKLLHAGVVGTNDRTRVSIEISILVDKKN